MANGASLSLVVILRRGHDLGAQRYELGEEPLDSFAERGVINSEGVGLDDNDFQHRLRAPAASPQASPRPGSTRYSR